MGKRPKEHNILADPSRLAELGVEAGSGTCSLATP
jgi:hypothetical protein